MKLTTFSEWRTKGGAISILGPWLAISLFEDEDRAHAETEGKMSFLDHLEELRTRLIISLGEIAISLIVC